MADTRPNVPARGATPAPSGNTHEPGKSEAPHEEKPRASRKAPREKTPPASRKAPDDPGLFVAPGPPDASEPPRPAAVPAPPEPRATPPSTDGAEAFVRDYYTAIDEQRFDDAWAVLSSRARSGFGGFDRWKAGYAKTLSNTPNEILTTTRGDRVIVRLRLDALEQGCPIARPFTVTWTLGRPGGEWVVAGLRASPDGPSSCG